MPAHLAAQLCQGLGHAKGALGKSLKLKDTHGAWGAGEHLLSTLQRTWTQLWSANTAAAAWCNCQAAEAAWHTDSSRLHVQPQKHAAGPTIPDDGFCVTQSFLEGFQRVRSNVQTLKGSRCIDSDLQNVKSSNMAPRGRLS